MNIPIRPRRNRQNAVIRGLCRETLLAPADFIYPLFLHDDSSNDAIDSMPGCHRWSIDGLLSEISEVKALGVGSVVLFPAIAEALKTPKAEESHNPEGLIPRAIKAIKQSHPDITVITDVALDPYNSDGHDGIVAEDGRIRNDKTIEVLCNQAICQAQAGADIVAPSDMMDGRVAVLRNALDTEGFKDVSILSYTAKYASAYYGPFRGALDSAPKSGDKKTYQMDYANSREAIREAHLDEDEGADILMVKPAGAYLDIIHRMRESTSLPIAAYQVSGEYLMIKSAAAAGWLDESGVVLESLTAIKRAGADMILTYFAKDAARLLA